MTVADTLITRAELAAARAEAKKAGATLPERMTAIRAGASRPGGQGWFLVESRDGYRKEIWAFNAYQAKALAILDYLRIHGPDFNAQPNDGTDER